jgi:hypothetical protein
MGWATSWIAELKAGRTVSFRPRGHSMSGRIDHLDLVEVAPILGDPSVGDVVLCKVRGQQFLHLVSATDGRLFRISNNHGHVNGWTSRDQIFGRVISVRKT